MENRHEKTPQSESGVLMHTSVIIPCHNQGDTLERAVVSALMADAVIVVNDCSSDNTSALGRAMAEGYANVMYYETGAEVPAGVCFTRNYGISQAPEDSLIIPLDADDKLIADSVFEFRNHNEAGVFIYGGYIEAQTYHPPPPIGMLARKNVTQATFAFHKQMWKRAGGYDPHFEAGYEDWALMCALVERGYQALRLDQAMLITYGGGRRSNDAAKYNRFLIAMLRDKYPGVFAGVGINAY